MKSLWGSPEDMKKGKNSKKTKPQGDMSFSNSTSLKDMKSNTLTENGGWGKNGVKAQSGFKVGSGKGKGQKGKVFKSMGF